MTQNTYKDKSWKNQPLTEVHDPVPRSIRIVCISDVHNLQEKLEMPEGDVLIVAGDLTNEGSFKELRVFSDWLDDQDYLYKIVVPGNHDLKFETHWKKACKALPAADAILNQESYYIDDLHVYGEPRQPWFYDWAFNVHRERMKKECWDKVPKDVDILVTHGPPFGAGDKTVRGAYVGCVEQRKWIEKYQPRLVVCGHVHPGHGTYMIGQTVVLNVAVAGEHTHLANGPTVITLDI